MYLHGMCHVILNSGAMKKTPGDDKIKNLHQEEAGFVGPRRPEFMSETVS